MVRKMDEWHPKHRPITKIMLPDGVKGVPLPGRWDCGTISMKLNVIWGMSVKAFCASRGSNTCSVKDLCASVSLWSIEMGWHGKNRQPASA